MWRRHIWKDYVETHQRLALAHVLAPKQELPIQIRDVDRIEINLYCNENSTRQQKVVGREHVRGVMFVFAHSPERLARTTSMF